METPSRCRPRSSRRAWLRRPLICAVALCCADWTATAQDVPVPPGDTRFDATDRLAITNLLGAMVRGLDELDLDLLVSTVAPEFSAEYRIPGSPVMRVEGRERFREMMAGRFAAFRQAGIQRRHIVTPPYFLEQTPDSARVAIHFLNCTATQGQGWHAFISARAEFELVKRSGVWFFLHQLEIPDAPLDISNAVLLPGIQPETR